MDTPVTFHLSLNVSDLARSVAFYRVLFGREPAKCHSDYAKFEVDDPPLIFSLVPHPPGAGGTLSHVGLKVADEEAIARYRERLEAAGLCTQAQNGTVCGYARQNKFWVTDPDRTLWEVYTLHEDIDHSGFDDPPPPQAAPAEAVWEHRLTEAVPGRLPHADDSLDEVRLEGTFNAALSPAELERLLAEARRALKPGGRLAVHGLAGDRPFPGTPKLPGLASLVRHVPTHADLLAALERAGFAGLFFEKLGDIHCFHVDGVELREVRLLGWKQGRDHSVRLVMYKGPLEEVEDADGTVFRRGEPVSVPASVAERLRQGPAADQFAFL
jgi:catechol 2,3-dioxygenase-like lactoylglutathione lyase family enzyme